MSYQKKTNISSIYGVMLGEKTILSKMLHVTIEMSHPNGNFRMDISIIGDHQGEVTFWTKRRQLLWYSRNETKGREICI